MLLSRREHIIARSARGSYHPISCLSHRLHSFSPRPTAINATQHTILTTPQMHPQNGPPLPLDIQLRLAHHLPSLPALPLLRDPRPLPLRIPPVHAPPPPLAHARPAHLARPLTPPANPPLRRLRRKQLHPVPARHLAGAQSVESGCQYDYDRSLGDLPA